MTQGNDLDYAKDVKTENEKTVQSTDETFISFDEYFADYKNYGGNGKIDKVIKSDAKKVFNELKTPEAIQTFFEADDEVQKKMVSGLNKDHSNRSFYYVCKCALDYASYVQEYIKDNPQKQLDSKEENTVTSRLAELRKKMAGKIDSALGTNLSDIKLPEGVKKIETNNSKRFDRSGR